MLPPVLALLPVGFVLAWVLTLLMRRVALRLDFVDKPGGRKAHAKVTPLLGGVAIFWAVSLPLLAVAVAAHVYTPPVDSGLRHLLGGVASQTPLLLTILGCLAGMHVLGLVDDRRALGPYVKLAAQVGITALLVLTTDLRILTALGPVASAGLTILWIVAITNAFNFLDNMDGLSAGIAAVASAAFLITALTIGQLFIAAALALILGACLGFLCFNFAPASIFMGDSGSLVLGFLLAVLTVRTTFLPPGEDVVSRWYTLFAPVIVLAVPLYDLVVVSVLRLMRGRSPFQGDTNHFSHRLVRRGMSRRGAVLCIYLITGTTALAAAVLPHVHSTLPAVLLFGQTLLILAVIGILEAGPDTVVFPAAQSTPTGKDAGKP
jgi:UDP-GlcNAc:undecaprenyl-phosphate/decaprenyl-phosphate GlcNAc-1-phosphate transferase